MSSLTAQQDAGDGYCQGRDGIAESNGENSGAAISFAAPVFHFIERKCICYKKA